MANRTIYWLGDSLTILRSFPEEPRQDLGYGLWKLELGEQPMNSRPMLSIAAGVFELKAADETKWYRAVYYGRVRGQIIILHCFAKNTRKTELHDLDTARRRLRNYLQWTRT